MSGDTLSKAHYECVQHFDSLSSADWVEELGWCQSNRWLSCWTSFYQLM